METEFKLFNIFTQPKQLNQSGINQTSEGVKGAGGGGGGSVVRGVEVVVL